MRDPINAELHSSRHDHARKEPHGQRIAHPTRLTPFVEKGEKAVDKKI